MSNIGTVDAVVNLDFKKAEQSYARFQQRFSQNLKKSNPLQRMARDSNDFEQSLGRATNRIVSLGAAAAVFNTLSRSVDAFVGSLIEVDKSLTEINVNLNQSAKGLQEFGSKLFDVARDTGQSFETAAKAAVELARQGLGAEETIKRLKDALILSRISGLDASDAVDTLTAAINSFNKEALTSSEVVAKFAAVDTQFAVSSKDLAEAVSRVGSASQAAGVGIDQLIGLVTSLQQTTALGGANIGNGLKSIFTRIQASPETIDALQSVGVSIKDINGNLRDGISILQDYVGAREKLTGAEQAGLDRTVAGTFQINKLKAALGDIAKANGVYARATLTAAGATDEAIHKNGQLNESLSSLINDTTVSVKQFFAAVGNNSVGVSLRNTLEFFKKAREFLAGDNGNDLGKSIGTSILNGITNVLNGPAVLALAIVLGKAFLKIFDTIRQEASSLLEINSASTARARIQENINALLKSATVEEEAQYSAARGVIEQKQILLAIQERYNRELLVGSEIQNSFLAPGRLGQGSVVKELTGIRGFADPIASAIAKESAVSGLPTSQVYVDKHPLVASASNPAGILVANTRDEPLGGYQGVNRVIAQGGNPKSGSVPGFANLKTQVDLVMEREGLKKTFEGAALTSKELAMRATEGVTASAQKLADTLKLVDKAFVPLLKEAVLSESVARSIKASQAVPPSSFVPPVGGGLDRSGTFSGLFPPPPGPPSGSPSRSFGPAFPINPDLRGRLEGENITRIREKALRQAAVRARAQALVEEERARKEALETSRIDEDVSRSQNRRNKQRESILNARQKRQRVALGASFVLPFLSGFVEPGLQRAGISTASGTTGGKVSGALQGGLQGASLGVFGPQFGAIGAVVGALAGGLSKFGRSVEDITGTIEEQNSSNQKSLDAANITLQTFDEIKEARAGGASSKVLGRLGVKFSGAISRIEDKSLRAAFDTGDSENIKEAMARLGEKSAANASASSAVLALTKNGPGNFLGGQLDKETTDSVVKNIASALAGSKTNVNLQSLYGPAFGQTDTKTAITDVKAALDEIGEVAPAFKELQVNAGNVTVVARLLLKSFSEIKKGGDAAAKTLAKTGAQGIGLNRDAFTSSLDASPFVHAGLVSRNPSSFTQRQRGESQYDFIQSLASAGGLSSTLLNDSPIFKKSLALKQTNNVLNPLLAFAQQVRPGGTYLNAQGEPDLKLLQTAFKSIAKGKGETAENAQFGLEALTRLQNSLDNAGVKRPPVVRGGLVEGVSYSTYAGESGQTPSVGRIRINPYGVSNDRDDKESDRRHAQQYLNSFTPAQGSSDIDLDAIKAAQNAVNKTIEAAVVRCVVQIDGTIKVLSDTLSGDQLKTLSDELTATIGKQFSAQVSDVNNQIAIMRDKPVPPRPPTSVGDKMAPMTSLI